jgi:hypothetical protein
MVTFLVALLAFLSGHQLGAAMTALDAERAKQAKVCFGYSAGALILAVLVAIFW